MGLFDGGNPFANAAATIGAGSIVGALFGSSGQVVGAAGAALFGDPFGQQAGLNEEQQAVVLRQQQVTRRDELRKQIAEASQVEVGKQNQEALLAQLDALKNETPFTFGTLDTINTQFQEHLAAGRKKLEGYKSERATLLANPGTRSAEAQSTSGGSLLGGG